MLNQEYGRHLHGGQEGVLSPRSGSSRTRVFLQWAVLIALGGLTLAPGCTRELEEPPILPGAAIDLISPTSVEAVAVAHGLVYYMLKNEEEPWSVHLLRVELGRCELGFGVLEAPVQDGPGPGRSRVSDLALAAGEEVLAAVNGDFFTPEGLPVGTEIVAGQVRRVRSRPALAWHPEKQPWVGTPELVGDSVAALGWELSRVQGDGGTEVIGGFPLLLQGGSRVGDLEVSDRPGFAAERHPRTAVGFDPKGDLLWIVVVDGRQPDHSMGMTLPEMTSLFEALAVQEAINLDGGGSSVMVLGGEPVSSPSDAEGERPVANALGVRLDPGLCRIRN
jgi:hypothetical protein